MLFFTALGVVAIMLLYALPGFLLVKTKLVKGDSISAFAKLLMYVSSPCLVFHSLTKNNFSWDLTYQMLLAFAIVLTLLLLGLFGFYFAFKKRSADVKYRIYTIATTLANGAFMGVPILEALFPNHPQAIAFSAMYSLAMNILGWSVASFIISQDKKYVSVKKILLNPATIALVIAIPFFAFDITLPTLLNDMITLLAKMSTPLCMLIMGMRLACSSIKDVFSNPWHYLIIGIKQILFPLVTFLILLPLPIDATLKGSIYIILACPVASVVLNFAEMLGQGQKTASSLVLLGTSLSALTIPLMSLLVPFF